MIGEAINRLKQRLTDPADRRKRAFFIDKPAKGRRFVIADIHGCYQSFDALLEKIGLTRDDQLFLLGDLIDRGPYSYLVVMRVAALLNQGYQVYPLRGNHEQLMLDFNREKPVKLKTFARRQFAAHLLSGSGHLLPEVDAFFSSLPYYYETDRAFMVHAGFNTRKKHPFDEWKDMIWIRDFEYRKKTFDGKAVIHGHVPVKLSKIRKGLSINDPDINLDNGCVKGEIDGYGRLVCLDLDSRELYTVKNRDITLS